MRLGIVLAVIGFAGVLVTLSGFAIFPVALELAETPWPFIAGVGFFIIFALGMYRVRRALKEKRRR